MRGKIYLSFRSGSDCKQIRFVVAAGGKKIKKETVSIDLYMIQSLCQFYTLSYPCAIRHVSTNDIVIGLTQCTVQAMHCGKQPE